jgi:hypothetical protein
MKSSRRSALAAWVRCIGRAIHVSERPVVIKILPPHLTTSPDFSLAKSVGRAIAHVQNTPSPDIWIDPLDGSLRRPLTRFMDAPINC